MINELVASQAIAPVKDDVSPVHVGARYEQSRGTGDVELVEARVRQRWAKRSWEVDERQEELMGIPDGEEGGPVGVLQNKSLSRCRKPMEARVEREMVTGEGRYGRPVVPPCQTSRKGKGRKRCQH